jgi:hypothetical protein
MASTPFPGNLALPKTLAHFHADDGRTFVNLKDKPMAPRIRFFALLFLFIPCAAGAEVTIAVECRVKNRPPGRCGWCAVETLARHLKIKALYGLTANNPCRACPEDLEGALEAAGVSYRIQYPGNRSTSILRSAIREGRGAAVGFRECQPRAGGHIVTLVDFGPTKVKVIDSSDPVDRVRTMSRERFLYWWDGFALVLEKKNTRKD